MKKLIIALALITNTSLFNVINVAFAETRVALVIGNDEYVTLPNLNNAANDAKAMAVKLESLGFKTILETNISRRNLGRTLERFQDHLSKADVGLVFYAGHGIQLNGKNYLVPSDAHIEAEEDLRYEAIPASDFLEKMANAKTPLNIIIIDACRDNPLPQRSRSGSAGLAVEAPPNSIKGTAIIYSAGAGQVARDGPKGGNGVFTQALLDVLDRPGLKLEDVFKQTAAQVAKVTKNKQDPWINSSIKGDFYFKTKPSSRNAAIAPVKHDVCAQAGKAWQYVEKSQRPSDFEAFINRYPECFLTDLAKTRLVELKPNSGLRATRRDKQKSALMDMPIKIFEIRENASVSCAAVHVRNAKGDLVTLKAKNGGQIKDSHATGMCGLRILAVDTKNSPIQKVTVRMSSGRFVGQIANTFAPPANPDGSWELFIPRTIKVPIAYEIKILTKTGASFLSSHRILP